MELPPRKMSDYTSVPAIIEFVVRVKTTVPCLPGESPEQVARDNPEDCFFDALGINRVYADPWIDVQEVEILED